jgi:hypothetical protein
MLMMMMMMMMTMEEEEGEVEEKAAMNTNLAKSDASFYTISHRIIPKTKTFA